MRKKWQCVQSSSLGTFAPKSGHNVCAKFLGWHPYRPADLFPGGLYLPPADASETKQQSHGPPLLEFAGDTGLSLSSAGQRQCTVQWSFWPQRLFFFVTFWCKILNSCDNRYLRFIGLVCVQFTRFPVLSHRPVTSGSATTFGGFRLTVRAE